MTDIWRRTASGLLAASAACALTLAVLLVLHPASVSAEPTGARASSPRFHDNGNDTVTDNRTALVWLKNANINNYPVTWPEAVQYIDAMNSGKAPNFGSTDWRLPSLPELISLFDKTRRGPALPEGHPFRNVQNSLYWSSTGGLHVAAYVWAADMAAGTEKSDYASGCTPRFFWPVRGASTSTGVVSMPSEGAVTEGLGEDALLALAAACKKDGKPPAQKPAPPSVLSAIATSESEAVLSWDPPVGASDVSIYKVYEGTRLIKAVRPTWASLSGLDLSRPRCYQISSLSSAGVESRLSQETCALPRGSIASGSLWSLGVNDYGQLGDGTRIPRGQLVMALGLTSNVVDIASGINHTVALRSDGTVWCWGRNLKGQLGDGTEVDSSRPVQVKGLTDVVAVAAGLYHSVALKKDGTVWSWGRNYYGQLGDGRSKDSPLPVKVFELDDVRQVVAGWYHTLALKNDGTVWAWGWNLKGQLGQLSSNRSLVPVQVGNLPEVARIGAGMYHSMALTKRGELLTWGWNKFGQLGDGTTMNSAYPVRVIGLTNIVDFAGGMHHSVALKNDGTVWGWGRNDYGQIGPVDLDTSYTAVQVQGLPGDIVSLSAGAHNTAALTSQGSLWAWGWLYGPDTISSPKKWSALDGFRKSSSGQNYISLIR